MSEPAYKETTIGCPKCGTVLKLTLTRNSEIVLVEVLDKKRKLANFISWLKK